MQCINGAQAVICSLPTVPMYSVLKVSIYYTNDADEYYCNNGAEALHLYNNDSWSQRCMQETPPLKSVPRMTS